MVDLGNLGYRFVVGIVIGQLIDEILRRVGIVLSCKENLESLQAKVKSLQTIITQLEKRELNNGQRNSVHEIRCNGQITATKLALKNWVVKLQDLHRDSSEMEQNIPRINVNSRYGTGNKIKQKISDLDNHLKLVPVIKLELALWSLMQIPVKTLSNPVNLSEVSKPCLRKLVKVSVIKQILGDIKMVLCFNNEVASLTELVTSIRPIFDEICEMQDRRLRAINEWLTSLSQLLQEADNIKWVPWWNVICRYKKGREITSLISDIEAHVKLASVINLEPLFHVIWRGRAAPTIRSGGFRVGTTAFKNGKRLSTTFAAHVHCRAESNFNTSNTICYKNVLEQMETFREVEAPIEEGLSAAEEVEGSSEDGLGAPLLRGPALC